MFFYLLSYCIYQHNYVSIQLKSKISKKLRFVNNVMYFIIDSKYILDDLCKYTLLVIYSVLFKYFIMYGITLFGKGCDNPVYLSHQCKSVAWRSRNISVK